MKNDLRVLWYVDVPPDPLAERTGQAIAVGAMGWVESLRRALAHLPGLRLGIASTAPAPCSPFQDDGVMFYAVPGPRPSRRWAAAPKRWLHPSVLVHDLAPVLTPLLSFGPDVVQVHGTEGPFGLLAGNCPVPCIVSLQGLLVTYTRFWLQGIPTREFGRLLFTKQFRQGLGLLHEHVDLQRRAERERLILESGSDYIGRTQWDRRVLLGANPNARYWHCDEVLRTPFYSARWSSPSNSQFVIYSTGSSMPFKGTESLVEAVAIASRAGMPDVRLRVAGVPSGSELEAIYHRLADHHHVGDRVKFLGRLDAAHLVGELLGCDVYVHPSRIDNSPNSLAEAMLLGVPCVATFAGGIPSMVDDGVSGLLVQAGDPYALAGAIRGVRDDPATAAALGRQARTTALMRHDPEHIATRMLEIYAAVAGGQPLLPADAGTAQVGGPA